MMNKIGEIIRYSVEGIAGQAAAIWSVFLLTDMLGIKEEKWYTIKMFYPDTTFVSDITYYAFRILLTGTLCFVIVTLVEKLVFVPIRRARQKKAEAREEGA